MKQMTSITLLFLSTLAISSQADTTTQMSPSEAKTAWESLSPEQQAALMQKAKSEASAKQDSWQSLSPEEQAAKKTAAKDTATEKAAPYVSSFKSGMAAKRAARGR